MKNREKKNDTQSDYHSHNHTGISDHQCHFWNHLRKNFRKEICSFKRKKLFHRFTRTWRICSCNDNHSNLHFRKFLCFRTRCCRHDLWICTGLDCSGSGSGSIPYSWSAWKQNGHRRTSYWRCFRRRIPQGTLQERRTGNCNKPSHGGIHHRPDDLTVQGRSNFN